MFFIKEEEKFRARMEVYTWEAEKREKNTEK